METLEQLFKQRLTKLEMARSGGADPYQLSFKRDGSVQELLDRFREGDTLKAAGRLTALRNQGKITFADLRDGTAKIQLLFAEEKLGSDYGRVDLLDIGDIVGAQGQALVTKRGEKTIQVERFHLLSKALRTLPEKWHGLQNQEQRYRKRYLDLLGNPESKEVFRSRTRLICGIRRFLDERGFLEVETPMMQPIPGGAAGKPFKTHHNALGMDLYLRIAPELYLKRLLVGGFDKVYEINRNFRNEGLSTRHNPEFTMLEVYEAYGDCRSMMELTEEMVTALAQELRGGTQIEFAGQRIDLKRPWKRISFADLAKQKAGIEPADSMETMVEKLQKKGQLQDSLGPDLKKLPRTQLAKIVMGWLDHLSVGEKGAPTFVTEFFDVFSPLAKAVPGKPGVADRFELFIGGMEIANAYSEQNDPIEQRRKLEAYRQVGGEEAQVIDEDFLEALEHAMPPAGGLGIGVDRLTMLLTGKETIRDVVLFPTLRPETGEGS
ncbi:MAG: lysine--tRNA ligase [Candidatus Omnitrophica bacterium]|nr:lysine--tRNA ligase [Candidatus Omnitrophota bacterium]